MKISKVIDEFKGKRVLITGACGTVGSRLTKKILELGAIVCAYDNNENGLFVLDQELDEYSQNLRLFMGDVRDEKRLSRICSGVDIIFHCAAMKHVSISEYNPDENIKTNVDGVNNVIHSAILNNVEKVIFTSSDKAVNPSNTMGASKLLGEKLIIAANNIVGDARTRFSVVRFGNILDSSGSVVEIFKQQVLNKKAITITSTEMTRFVLTKDDSIKLCLSACDKMKGGELFIQNMGVLNIFDLAKVISGEYENLNWIEIGCKAGEKLYEELSTELESNRGYHAEEMMIVLPEVYDFMPKDSIENFEYILNNNKKYKTNLRSDCVTKMSLKEIEDILKEA